MSAPGWVSSVGSLSFMESWVLLLHGDHVEVVMGCYGDGYGMLWGCLRTHVGLGLPVTPDCSFIFVCVCVCVCV